MGRVVYSFVVDTDPRFSAQAWFLAHSLCGSCHAAPADIHIQLTPGVSSADAAVFREAGFTVLQIERFGDGKWCNKIAQLPNLFETACDHIVLLDTDMIALNDIRPFLRGDAVQAKVVDCPNPSLATLLALLAEAGCHQPPLTQTDAGAQPTVLGNANGGFYAVPQPLARDFHEAWRDWALWLLTNGVALVRENKTQHIDQVSAAMAFRVSGLPFAPVPANLNYFIHFRAEHSADDATQPICLLHHHASPTGPDWQITPAFPLTGREQAAVAAANALIRDHPYAPPMTSDASVSAPAGALF